MSKLGRPIKPMISRQNATRAALKIIDEQGLGALSLGEVAKRLKVKAPSLYHHFHNKAELLAGVAKYILREIKLPETDPSNWEESFVQLCLATRRTILKHPNAAPLLLQYFPRTLLLGAYEFWISQCPYPHSVRMLIIDASEKLTFGSSLYAAAVITQETPAMPEFSEQDFPALAQAIDNSPYDDEELFVESIRVFLAGLAVRFPISASAAKTRASKPKAGVVPKRTTQRATKIK